MAQRKKQRGVHLIQFKKIQIPNCSHEKIAKFRCQLFESTDRAGAFLD